jgi:hypothetical protein
VLGPALPANAENKKDVYCYGQICLWYSDHADSPYWDTNANDVKNLIYDDFFGTESIVRNNAHSAADQGGAGAYYDFLFVYPSFGTPRYYGTLNSTTNYDYANTLAKGIINNEASYYDSIYCGCTP